MKLQKVKVRRHNKKWLKHGLDSLWLAYKKERNKYYTMLKCKKTECYRDKIDECKRNPQRLHQLVQNLTNKPVEQCPEHSSKEELANDFAKFFENKILAIREKFVSIPQYRPEQNESVPKLRRFTPMTSTEVELISKNMKSKTCELDVIPTHLLKEMLPSLISTIMEIVNLSLSNGFFCESWKTAIVQLLIK